MPFVDVTVQVGIVHDRVLVGFAAWVVVTDGRGGMGYGALGGAP